MPNRGYLLKGKSTFGSKKSKERISVILVVNLKGEKMKPMIIGKAKNPSSFPKFILQQSFYYASSQNAWLTSTIFSKYLSLLNLQFKIKNKKICLILDNCSSHILKEINFSNINLFYIPPNTTPIAQPLDGG